ncbi:hypothetical protein [Flavobacterium aquiphilum]|uniref:hypothetical protein n=1 Tax=Flavobacterium aquiphilum TaxID=3003261 RepID=UPI0024808E64|nr:hypothetical protein [Flavobacterium aquiphilum]
MYGLTKKEKLNIILKKVKELDLTAYDIAKNTPLTEAGIIRIINGTSKNPQENSLNTILEFLENKVLASEIGKTNQVKEPTSEYRNNDQQKDLRDLLDCKEKCHNLLLEVIRLQGILRKNNIEFDDNFEM